jgi:replicative DNA helicase
MSVPMRIPPHNLDAERAVLGAILLEGRETLPRVIELLKPSDFYTEAHRLTYQGMLALFNRSEPVDVLTLTEELRRSDQLEIAGGPAALALLVEQGSISAYLNSYASIVRDMAVLRELIQTSSQIIAQAFEAKEDVQTLVDDAERKIFGLAERRLEGSALPIGKILRNTFEYIERLYERKEHVTGVATGFEKLDLETSGFQPSDFIIIAGRPSMGKAQPLDAKIKTTIGWKLMGELRLGDELASVDGRRSLVSGIFPQGVKPVFRVTFSDGRSTTCTGEHLWRVHYRGWPDARVLETSQVVALLQKKRYRHRLWIDVPSGDFGHSEALPVDPYVLGALLGDGSLLGSSLRFSTAESEMLDRILERARPAFALRAAGGYDWRIVQTTGAHRAGVAGVNPNRAHGRAAGPRTLGETCRVEVHPRRLSGRVARRPRRAAARPHGYRRMGRALGQHALLLDQRATGPPGSRTRSLARRLVLRSKPTHDLPRRRGQEGRPHGVRVQRSPSRSEGPVPSVGEEDRAQDAPRRRWRPVFTAIEPAGVADTQCIAVTHPSRLYVTDDYVVTHNTAFALNIAQHVGIALHGKVLVLSLEMSSQQIVQRMLCSEAKVDSQAVRTGYLTSSDWHRLTAAAGRLSEASIFIDDSPGLTVLEARAKARRMKAEHGLDLLVIDYLQLMRGRAAMESRQQEISEISRSLKALAKELNIPVVALSQLSRAVEARQARDFKPQLSDLRECVTGDTLVLLSDGRRVAIQDLVETAPEVLAISSEGKIVKAKTERIWAVGARPVFSVRLASGRTIRATAQHKLLSGRGWATVAELRVGERLAIARTLPEPIAPERWPDQRVALLGQLIGDGSYLNQQPLRYTTSSEENSETVARAAREEFGCRVTRYSGRRTWHQLLISGNGNRWHHAGVNGWLRELGIFGQRSHQKRIPEAAFLLSTTQIALLLRHLWATDGTIAARRTSRGSDSISYATNSPGLAGDVAALLLRLGIVARISSAKKGQYRPSFMVNVSGVPNQRRFLAVVDAFGPRATQARLLRTRLSTRSANTNVDTPPIESFERVKDAMRARGISQRRMVAMRGTAYGGTSHFRFAPSRMFYSSMEICSTMTISVRPPRAICSGIAL